MFQQFLIIDDINPIIQDCPSGHIEQRHTSLRFST